MPYIHQITRVALDSGCEPQNIGEVNYLITKACKTWLTLRGENYLTYNELIGVLECAKLELYRRVVAGYEDTKIVENGDVY